MSDTDLHEINFEWPYSEPNSVVVTGTFDQWSSSQALTKTRTGFVGTARVPWGRKILYKFIVDGRWSLKNDQPIEVELGTGFINHVYVSPPKPVKVLPNSGGIIADAGGSGVTKGSSSPIGVDRIESAVPPTTVPVSAPEKNTHPSSSPSPEHPVAAVPDVTPHTEDDSGKPAKEVEEPSTQAPIVTKPVEEVKDVVAAPEDAEKAKEESKTAKVPLEPEVAKPTEVPTVKPERPSSETAYSTPSGRPPSLPTTPTKPQPFPTSESPGSPPSPSSFKFNSLRSGGGKKRTRSFLQRIRDHFKSDKEKSPKAQEKQ